MLHSWLCLLRHRLCANVLCYTHGFIAANSVNDNSDILHDYHAVGKHTTYLDKSDLDLDNIPIYEPRASNINSDENCDRDIDPECPDLLHWLPVLSCKSWGWLLSH